MINILKIEKLITTLFLRGDSIMKKLIMLSVVFSFLMTFGAGGAYATSISGSNLQDTLDSATLGPIGGSSSVTVNNIADQVTEGADAYWSNIGSAGADVTFFMSNAGFANCANYSNCTTIGIYDAADPSNQVQFFMGEGDVGQSANVKMIASGGGYDVQVNNVSQAIFGGNSFGFYVSTPEGPGYTYYSDTSLNPDSFDKFIAFGGKGDTLNLPAPASSDVWNSNEYVMAFEDLLNGGDTDYNDMVLYIQQATPVPEPSTIIILGAALLGFALFRRKDASS